MLNGKKIEHHWLEKSTYNHANIVPVSFFSFFDCFINNKIHEWVKSSQDTNNIPSAVEFYCDIMNT